MRGAVEVPAAVLFDFLRSKGFVECDRAWREVVYERRHEKDPRFVVVVYTSVSKGRARARGVGKDAIRVCAIYDDTMNGGISHGVKKLPRVHRAGSVEATLDRMLGRMREAYAACNERIKR